MLLHLASTLFIPASCWSLVSSCGHQMLFLLVPSQKCWLARAAVVCLHSIPSPTGIVGQGQVCLAIALAASSTAALRAVGVHPLPVGHCVSALLALGVAFVYWPSGCCLLTSLPLTLQGACPNGGPLLASVRQYAPVHPATCCAGSWLPSCHALQAANPAASSTVSRSVMLNRLTTEEYIVTLPCRLLLSVWRRQVPRPGVQCHAEQGLLLLAAASLHWHHHPQLCTAAVWPRAHDRGGSGQHQPRHRHLPGPCVSTHGTCGLWCDTLCSVCPASAQLMHKGVSSTVLAHVSVSASGSALASILSGCCVSIPR